MESRKNKSGNSAILTKVLAVIVASIPAISYIATALINRKSRKEAIDAKGEKDKDVHKQANLDDFDLEKKKSGLRVEEKRQILELKLEEKRQMLELELNHKERLAKMSSACSEEEETDDSLNSLFKPLSVDEVQHLDTLPVVPMAGYYIEQGSLITICAPSGIGKTTIAYQIVLHASRGTQPEFVNGVFETYGPNKGIVYDAENNQEDLNRILKDYPEIAKCPVQIISEPDFDDDEELFLKDIRTRVEEDLNDYVVVIDSISTILDTSRPKSMKRFMRGIRRLQSDRIKIGQRITVVLIDHTIKNTDKFKPIDDKNIAGASYISRYSKITWSIFPIKDHSNSIGLYSIKRRFMPSPDTVEILERIEDHSFSPGFRYVDTITEDELKNGYCSNHAGDLTDAQQQQFIQLMTSTQKLSNKQIAAKLGISERSVYNWKKKLGI